MKIRYWSAMIFIFALLCLAGCTMGSKVAQTPVEGGKPEAATTAPSTTQPQQESTTQPTTQPITLPTESDELTYGWFKWDGKQYYILENGGVATGKVEIDGKIRYFSDKGEHILLANPWNYIPDDYDPDLVELSKSIAVEDCYVERSCYDDLLAMLRDCNEECPSVCVVSGYRTHDYQTRSYERKVNFYMDSGYERAEAERLAGMVIAKPGTSEHQLGLAVDIVDTRHWALDEVQADLPAQKWLMENSWKYGFILRYPNDKSEITGIIYEPWHYRYVGKEIAEEIHKSGLTLEEYLENL